MKPTTLFSFLFLSLTTAILYGQKQDIFLKNPELSHTKWIEGFSIQEKEGFTILAIYGSGTKENPEALYALVHRDSLALKKKLKTQYKHVISIPVKRWVTTSTTHLPALSLLNAEETLVGFPGTKYISSESFRTRIAQHKIKELGSLEKINIEMLLETNPELLVGFSIGEEPKAYQTVRNAGIPVLINSDWLAKHPLGKAAWIYFFGALLNKLEQADMQFKAIVLAYERIKVLAKKATYTPNVFSGALFKGVWYAPGGQSWAAQFIKDAKGHYLFNSQSTGSDSYALEQVLTTAHTADIWLGPAQHTSYDGLLNSSAHYQQFKAFKNKKVYTFAAKKGSTGGVLYYELAPQRPDIVLKDIAAILHPELFPNHSLFFFSPLDE